MSRFARHKIYLRCPSAADAVSFVVVDNKFRQHESRESLWDEMGTDVLKAKLKSEKWLILTWHVKHRPTKILTNSQICSIADLTSNFVNKPTKSKTNGYISLKSKGFEWL